MLTANSLVFAGTYYDGRTGQVVDGDQILNLVKSGTVLIASELHDHEAHHQNQRDLLVKFSGASFPISVGMEFFSYPDQAFVDGYVSGQTDEATFLKQIKWDGSPNFLPLLSPFKSSGFIGGLFEMFKNFSFDFYRFQVRFSGFHQGRTLALNFPRELSGKVSKGGLDALSPAEKAMMPPDFARGAASYFERFHEIMKDHAKEEQIQNYFTAQSLWDDTMAWRAATHMAAHPTDLLMIIVGDFHVAYQDGLVNRLKARGVNNIVSISQIDTSQMSAADRMAEIMPDPKYGPRSDLIFDAH